MKLIAIYLSAIAASGTALLLYNLHALNPAEKLSDLALCEAEGQAYFINRDPQAYRHILQEIEKRKREQLFTINTRSCGLFGLASAVNKQQSRTQQIELALNGMRELANALSKQQQKRANQAYYGVTNK
ncbi:MAG TPA: hypothetical protein DCY50_05850 [Franconibacter helveticus]|uniref:hypothetical protein n=1 Tax=Franconibacter helveticus TaxID=357240 RepID=UPI0004191B13|nr:hypothetical protein [Franconibacter helveticus]MDU6925776.1 hypothetical protein [Franconibacter helveticus]HAZ54532.1 hypothetical protein [Franconibacter helveticus]